MTYVVTPVYSEWDLKLAFTHKGTNSQEYCITAILSEHI